MQLYHRTNQQHNHWSCIYIKYSQSSPHQNHNYVNNKYTTSHNYVNNKSQLCKQQIYNKSLLCKQQIHNKSQLLLYIAFEYIHFTTQDEDFFGNFNFYLDYIYIYIYLY